MVIQFNNRKYNIEKYSAILHGDPLKLRKIFWKLKKTLKPLNFKNNAYIAFSNFSVKIVIQF